MNSVEFLINGTYGGEREREREREREPRLVCVCGGGGGLCVEESKRKGRYKEEDEVNEWMRKKVKEKKKK